ncbi:NAD(P)-dependent oxidoreductase [Paracoccus aurantiacus]|uniref:NAD(P)-dependent oxidoreductase n=1 Tax=Paracoccus aurantiacus TaxID=2599412 RepID=A0A5C6S9X3_9RHOB|nr:NAD(P)-dependent oxidoreductase [Paracoccus aurantiacus]TXB71281.1 NAD(P)-dependent oxidoreductase [Paracoccus aurantiacus]
MKIAVTGGTGLVGRFIVNEAIGEGDEVTVMTRTPPKPGFFNGPVEYIPYDLEKEYLEINAFDAVIHAAFDHIPDRYRGGEGNDPQRFLRRNLDGSLRLFEAAARAGARVVFLSSRAVYGPQPGPLTEDMTCVPETLYGQAKLKAEDALLASGQPATILRATGVYGAPGPGQRHKWVRLFEKYASGEATTPRIGTEVHGQSLAQAVRIGLNGAQGVFNVSDIMLDRHDLLQGWGDVTGVNGPIPERAEAGSVSQMDVGKLKALGWRRGSMELLRPTLREMARQAGISPKDA